MKLQKLIIITILFFTLGCDQKSSSDLLFKPKKIIEVGLLKKGGNDMRYKNKIINQFSMGFSTSVLSEEMKKEFYELLGQQVIIYGELYSVEIETLEKENPSEYFKDMSSLSVSFVKAEKIEPIIFCIPVVPEKITLGEPLKFTVQIINPFNSEVTLHLHPYSINSYRQVKRKTIILSPKQKKNIEIVFTPLKRPDSWYWFEKEGTSIKIYMEGYCSENKKNCGISFDEIIATYNSDGYLQK